MRVKVKKPRTKPVPIRLDHATTGRLDLAAKRLSSNRAAVIRLAIHQMLPDIEAGQLTLK
jgi:predicted transcriptional regulator